MEWLEMGWDKTDHVHQLRAKETAAAGEPSQLSLTDLAGNECKQQPNSNQIPVLKPDQSSSGCTFKTFSHAPGRLDVSSFFAKEKPHSVWIDANLWLGGMSEGSGVIVGKKSPAECIVLTDRHVVRGTQEQEDRIADLEFISNMKNSRPDITVHATNGKKYPAEEVGEDPSRDLAALVVKTGPDTNSVCRPVDIPKKYHESPYGTSAYAISYPQNSKTPYLSIGTVTGSLTLDEMNKRMGADVAAQEKLTRPLIDDQLAIRHASSGAARYDYRGHFSGLIDRENDKTGHAFSTPLRRSDIDSILAKPPVFPQ